MSDACCLFSLEPGLQGGGPGAPGVIGKCFGTAWVSYGGDTLPLFIQGEAPVWYG
jgi:hypothetical protein